MDYQVLKAMDERDMAGQVKKEMDSGWRPLGGVAVVAIGTGSALYQHHSLYQAMSKHTELERPL